MGRLARVIAIDTPHHITQRANTRRFILESDADRLVYLQLLRHYAGLHQLSLMGYCVMSNHVHLIAIPERPDSLARPLKDIHGRYAAYFNARYLSSGHVWQGRYYSCPLDTPHLWAAMRYIERNPVRAGITASAEEFPWSSAAVHCGCRCDDGLLDLTIWDRCWIPATWRDYLGSAGEEEEEAIRRNTHTGRPLGGPEFVSALERRLNRKLAPRAGGRPPKREQDARQLTFGFGV